jgi:NAD-dependent SIR2 family protein deacetylase
VKRRGGVLIEFNPRESELSRVCDVTIKAPSGESLPMLVSQIKAKLV